MCLRMATLTSLCQDAESAQLTIGDTDEMGRKFPTFKNLVELFFFFLMEFFFFSHWFLCPY